MQRPTDARLHKIFVPTGRTSLPALRTIAAVMPVFRRHGITVVVIRVKPAQLRDRRVIAAFARKGIRSLPAAGSLTGTAAIATYYSQLAAQLANREIEADVAKAMRVAQRRRVPTAPPRAQAAAAAIREDLARNGFGEDENLGDSGNGRHGETDHDGRQSNDSGDRQAYPTNDDVDIDEYLRDAIRASEEPELD